MPSFKPYYADGLITLYLGDALERKDWLSGDVLVTDPPYGLDTRLSMTNAGGAKYHDWDSDVSARDRVLELWGDRPYAVFASPKRIDGLPRHRQAPLIWEKGLAVGGLGDNKFPWRMSYEFILVNGRGWRGPRSHSSVLSYPHRPTEAKRIGHPTSKPVALMKHLLSFAPEGCVVDPFAGSGSTLLAARSLGRPAVGIEIEERYCEIAANRLSEVEILDYE